MSEEVKQAKLEQNVAMKFIRNKKTTYDAMKRDGYWMPAMQSAICTNQWMDKVRFDANVWCPKHPNVTVRNCTDPPNKTVLIEILE